jgi:hypothetical protein
MSSISYSGDNNDDIIADMINLIKNNSYITNSKSNKKKDKTSLSYLFKDFNLSQSDNIKIGIALEKLLIDDISRHYQNIKYSSNIKNSKDKDHLFLDNDNKIIYYAELKSNINLDTEKTKETISKCFDIYHSLSLQFPDHVVIMSLVCLRYCNKTDIPSFLLKKFSNISFHLCGINDYYAVLQIKKKFTDVSYKIILDTIVKSMFFNQ